MYTAYIKPTLITQMSFNISFMLTDKLSLNLWLSKTKLCYQVSTQHVTYNNSRVYC